ncbi:dethiobiotin synthase [Peptoniphilus harei ACS-146-V-Sch2b]|uniref:ATP-dependent dethiobiotin synthetase BioD n=1 Tax=Peptoniphilus harei ACS-146-V-Sch2b TaxID=908338 RepID=E4KWD6_9FIRM|nr:dethiobiotin synthase [Peptoniphilus harei]EFR33773.1 dethiobiotin synthase [Peptoniphilus harei ACS-146-V-Sch2b]MDU6031737.1 dethiobiotin synthase [Peptoniphilus harei]MDU7532221.1 dethiobiotin synthase [Peptoniphilus harei]
MSKNIFVTGTGTEIGKTYVAGLLVKKLHEAGEKSAYYKAAMSGNDKDVDGNLIPGDAKFVKELGGIDQDLNEMCPYVYERAYSPHLAAQIEGNPVNLDYVVEKLRDLEKKYDYITLEGSGGILCPLRFDDEEIYLEDFVKKAKLSSIIVADAGLGTINNLVLTAFYMKEKGMKVKGIIFNNFIPGDVLQEDNIKMCEHMSGLKVLACVKKGDKDLDIDIDKLKEIYE